MLAPHTLICNEYICIYIRVKNCVFCHIYHYSSCFEIANNVTSLSANCVESLYWCHRFALQLVKVYVSADFPHCPESRIWIRHRGWHAANGTFPGSATSVPTPSREGSTCQSTRASCGSIGMVTMGGWVVLLMVSDQPWFHTDPSSTPQRPEHLWSYSVASSWKKQSWRGVVFRGAPVDMPGTKALMAACLSRMWLTVARVRPTWPAITLRCMP